MLIPGIGGDAVREIPEQNDVHRRLLFKRNTLPKPGRGLYGQDAVAAWGGCTGDLGGNPGDGQGQHGGPPSACSA